jgi:hypothetical protein
LRETTQKDDCFTRLANQAGDIWPKKVGKCLVPDKEKSNKWDFAEKPCVGSLITDSRGMDISRPRHIEHVEGV